jgi:hypothetical protein
LSAFQLVSFLFSLSSLSLVGEWLIRGRTIRLPIALGGVSGCAFSSGCMLATLEYNGVVGYLITAADGRASVNLTDPEWRALIYVASQHDFSAPHLRLERGGESVDMGGSDAQALRSALGKALEARDVEEIKTPDGELAYDAIQRVRHVLLSENVRLARTPA